jgi:hypothetical protein
VGAVGVVDVVRDIIIALGRSDMMLTLCLGGGGGGGCGGGGGGGGQLFS